MFLCFFLDIKNFKNNGKIYNTYFIGSSFAD